MTNIKCNLCGAVNGVADEVCKVCGAELKSPFSYNEPQHAEITTVFSLVIYLSILRALGRTRSVIE